MEHYRPCIDTPEQHAAFIPQRKESATEGGSGLQRVRGKIGDLDVGRENQMKGKMGGKLKPQSKSVKM